MSGRVTRILEKIHQGEPSATEDLLPIVYEELRRLAAKKLAAHRSSPSLQATVLVHDAYLRLVNDAHQQQWNSRGHFFCAAAEAMRRILVEQARRRRALKHGGDRRQIDLEIAEPSLEDPTFELISLDEVLTQFEQTWPEKAKLVKLRYFAGLTIAEAAESLQISESTAERHWKFARAWLFAKLSK